jgi:folate-dependent phosphoribosylglycinamide formyltransferase PurN
MQNRGIILLAQDGPSTRIVYHALQKEFGEIAVLLESPVSRIQFLRRRLKNLNVVTVIGQMLFVAGIVPLLRQSGKRRIEAIKHEFGLDESPIRGNIRYMSSVNSAEARQLLQQLNPGIVVVNGTRIIGKATLAAISSPFINMHMGITPLYRGVHGGYWACADGHPELAGTTVHFVDEGIDTGNIIDQATFRMTSEDSFATYPYLHLAVGIPILLKAVHEIMQGTLQRKQQVSPLPSKLRSHPTLWGYWILRLSKEIK